MTITSTLKQKFKLEPAPYIRRRLIFPAPLASIIFKVYEHLTLFLKFITGKRGKNPKETEANEGSEAITKSEITCGGENSMSASGNLKISTSITGNHVVSGKLGVCEKFGELGEEKENRALELEFSQVSRNLHFDLSCADLNDQSTAKQWSSNFTVDSGLAFSDLHSEIEFSRYTPSLRINYGNQFSNIRSVRETPSTTNYLSLRHMKQFCSLSSPPDIAIELRVEDESSHQSESVGFEVEKDKGSSQMPGKSQRREVVLPNNAATCSSTKEDDELILQKAPLQMVDSIGEANDDEGISGMSQNDFPVVPSWGIGGDATSGSESEEGSESGSDSGEDFDVDDVGGGGADPNEAGLRVVKVYVNRDLCDFINMNEVRTPKDLHMKLFNILKVLHSGHFLFYGCTKSYMERVESRRQHRFREKELFLVGSLVGDPAWVSISWEEFSAKLTEITVLWKPRLDYVVDGIRQSMPCNLFPKSKPLENGTDSMETVTEAELVEKVPEKVALVVNKRFMTYFDTNSGDTPNVRSLLMRAFDILRRHEDAEYMRVYGFDISYMSKSLGEELFPTVWLGGEWPDLLTALSEIRLRGRVDIFQRLQHERGY